MREMHGEDETVSNMARCGHTFCGMCLNKVMRPLPASGGEKQVQLANVDTAISCNENQSCEDDLWIVLCLPRWSARRAARSVPCSVATPQLCAKIHTSPLHVEATLGRSESGLIH